MPGKRDRCDNCGKPMRRLYMQKNKPNGTRGMAAMGWLCEGCNFSDLINQFKKPSPTNQHPDLFHDCNECGTTHMHGSRHEQSTTNPRRASLDYIVKLLGKNPKEGLILINNLDNPSEYLGLVFGIILGNPDQYIVSIAKSVFTTHGSYLQNQNLFALDFRKHAHAKENSLLWLDKFKEKAIEISLDINQIYGTWLIWNPNITDFTFDVIKILESSKIYTAVALKNNTLLAKEYVNRALSTGDDELALEWMIHIIKQGDCDFIEKYVTMKGRDATKLIMEQLDRTTKDNLNSENINHYFNALLKSEGAFELFLILMNYTLQVDTRHPDYQASVPITQGPYLNQRATPLWACISTYIPKLGNMNSENPLLKSIAIISESRNWSSLTDSEIVAALLYLIPNNYEYSSRLYTFLRKNYSPKNKDIHKLFIAAISQLESSDTVDSKEEVRSFLSTAFGHYSNFYKTCLLQRETPGIEKFLFSDDPTMRRMGISMGKSTELEPTIQEYLLSMSFLDTDYEVREAAADLVKISQIRTTSLLNIINQTKNSAGHYRSSRLIFDLEALKRIIDYTDSRLLTIILDHIIASDTWNYDLEEGEILVDHLILQLDKFDIYDDTFPIFKKYINIFLTNGIDSSQQWKLIDKLIRLKSKTDHSSLISDGSSVNQRVDLAFRSSKSFVYRNIYKKCLEVIQSTRIGTDQNNNPWKCKEHVHWTQPPLHCNACMEGIITNRRGRGLSDIITKKAAMLALAIDEQKIRNDIKFSMVMKKSKKRSDRKSSVNRRLMFIEAFATVAKDTDTSFIKELMKKDRSPRVKRELQKILTKIG